MHDITAHDAATLLVKARALRSDILAHRTEIEAGRKIPSSLAERLREAQMFELWLPRALGGPELPPADFVRVIEELTRADGSVGWCAAVSSVCSLLAGSLPEASAREIFKDHNIVAGTVNPTGKAVAVEGGYRVTGRWAYGSGIDNSAWIVGNCVVHDGETPRLKTSGAPEMRFILFPRAEVEIIDTWRVSGLRGTGSHDFRINEVFAPEAHSAPAFISTGAQPGALYKTPLISLFAVSLAAVTLGIARAAIDALLEMAPAKTPVGSTVVLRDKPIAQMQLAHAEALVRASRAYLLTAIEQQGHEVASGAPPSMEKRAAIRMACTYAGESCAEAVDIVHNLAGGSAIQESGKIERCFRDIHAATQHIGLAPSNYELAGRVLLGLDPGTLRF